MRSLLKYMCHVADVCLAQLKLCSLKMHACCTVYCNIQLHVVAANIPRKCAIELNWSNWYLRFANPMNNWTPTDAREFAKVCDVTWFLQCRLQCHTMSAASLDWKHLMASQRDIVWHCRHQCRLTSYRFALPVQTLQKCQPHFAIDSLRWWWTDGSSTLVVYITWQNVCPKYIDYFYIFPIKIWSLWDCLG